MSENRRRRNNGAQNRQVKKARTNNARRILLLVGLMSLVAVISIGGTIAWLTDSTGPVENTFTASNIDITLAESPNLDLKMVPGDPIAKDPKVTVVSGSEACWLFVKIEESTNLNSFISYSVATGWTQLKDNEGNDVTGVYYRQVNASDIGTPYSVLANDQVTVKDTVTKAMMDGLKATGATQPTLTFKAYACQLEGFNDDTKSEAENALAAWNEVKPAPVTP